MSTPLLLNSPLINYFHYTTTDKVGQLLAGGTLAFKEADNHSVDLATYADPQGKVVNPNPIVLGAVGQAPPIYLQKAPYYIEISDKYGNVVETIDHYLPNGGQSGSAIEGKMDSNFFTNGQFTYYLHFSKRNDTPHRIIDSETWVALGWQFIQDSGTTTHNSITFDEVVNEGIEASPLRELVLRSSEIQTAESRKDLVQVIGNINKYEGIPITLSFQLHNKNLSTLPVEVLLYKNYGDSGSVAEFLPMTTFQVTGVRKKYHCFYTMPTNIGKKIGNNAYLAIILRLGVGHDCTIGVTNALGLIGTVESPHYPPQPLGQEVSDMIGAQFQPIHGIDNNFCHFLYVNGKIDHYCLTGTMSIETMGRQKPDQLRCDGTELKVSDYTIAQIPNRRLFDVIGQTYGASGDLIVTSKGPVIDFESGLGAREKSRYTPGNMASKITIKQLKIGFPLNIKAMRLPNSSTVRCTFIDKFAPAKPAGAYYWAGYGIIGWYHWSSEASQVVVRDLNDGGPQAQAVVDLNFTTPDFNVYKTRRPWYADVFRALYFLEFASPSDNRRGGFEYGSRTSPMVINFSVDGQLGVKVFGTQHTLVFDFKGWLGLFENLDRLVLAINDGFEWTVTLKALPLASDYFEYSSPDVDYYAWFEVDGKGNDPKVVNRTGIKVAIGSADSLQVVAKKTAELLNSQRFSLPDAKKHLPTIPLYVKPRLDWYIHM